jgi:adenylate cyclase class 2
MAIEIELKAWVDDPQTVKTAASSFACYVRAFDKQDAYWYPAKGGGIGKDRGSTAIPPFGIRVRKETDTSCDETRTWVTYKTKETHDKIEVNIEREFAISDDKPFEELLALFGLEIGICKHKTGWAWDYSEAGGSADDADCDLCNKPHITLELAEVEGLGWFAEIEILAESDDAATVADARRRLLSLLCKLGIDEAKIESRYYTEMLREKRRPVAAYPAIN